VLRPLKRRVSPPQRSKQLAVLAKPGNRLRKALALERSKKFLCSLGRVFQAFPLPLSRSADHAGGVIEKANQEVVGMLRLDVKATTAQPVPANDRVLDLLEFADCVTRRCTSLTFDFMLASVRLSSQNGSSHVNLLDYLLYVLFLPLDETNS
jgi:hypothetical protein